MRPASLVIAFGVLAAETTDSVLLEQEPWDPYVGYLTLKGVYGYLNKLLFDAPEPAANCGVTVDGAYEKTVYAYPSRPELPYRFGLSWGTWSGPVVKIFDYSEVVDCNLELEPALKYPARAMTRYAWVAAAYSAEGSVLPHPVVTLTGTGIRLQQAVYGQLLVTYKVEQHAYRVNIPPRSDAIENKLQSVAYALWLGGTTTLELEAPPGAEEGACNNARPGSEGEMERERPDKYVDGEDTDYWVDYCSGEVSLK